MSTATEELGQFLTVRAKQEFWRRVEPWEHMLDPLRGCWLWNGHIMAEGYGVFYFGGDSVLAHRWAYQWKYGDLQADLTVDHVAARGCTHRSCVNPGHLEQVTRAENTRRGAPGKHSHCKHNHEFTPANTKTYRNGKYEQRMCLTCYELRKAAKRERSASRA